MEQNDPSIFRPTVNCWRTNEILRARLLVDSADFYRAVHQAIVNAKRSVFVVGWEIDSTIRLLRGEDESSATVPSVFVNLLAWKAEQNPDMQIYLLRWDASVAFFGEREFWPEYVWTHQTPENIHIALDDTIPIGGSHHQKLILIDDELVFTGGMDIARQRWDEREHRIVEPERTDANGPYGPYHDVQIMMDGPIVNDFAELIRWRWRQATDIKLAPAEGRARAEVWPGQFPPTLQNAFGGIARTIPRMEESEAFHEVRQMYLDLIAKAEDCIYIENQFLTSMEIAKGLNTRLKKCPKLKALLISSYNPQGILESEGMWAGRIDFRDALLAGLPEGQARIMCTGIDATSGTTLYKRIHSKIFVVDDRFLMVSSSNINNRSMDLDTECDFVIEAKTDEHRRWIAATRDDLRAEHESHGYTLRPTEDEKFTSQKFKLVAGRFADPREPLIAGTTVRNPGLTKIALGIVTILILIGLWQFVRMNMSWFHAENIRAFLTTSRASAWSLPTVCLVYILGGFVFFPVTVLSLVTAAVFGSIWGPIYGMCGALSSAAVMFWLGRWGGHKGLRRFFGERLLKVDRHFANAGILGVAILRMVPVAPFSIVNMAAGISSLLFSHFMIGSFLGFVPAFIVKGLIGDSLTQVFLDPQPRTIAFLVGGFILWVGLMVGTYVLTRRWKKKHQS